MCHGLWQTSYTGQADLGGEATPPCGRDNLCCACHNCPLYGITGNSILDIFYKMLAVVRILA